MARRQPANPAPHGKPTFPRRGLVELVLLSVLFAAGAAATYYFGFYQDESDTEQTEVQMHKVKKGPFEQTVTALGEIESIGDTFVRCQVKAKSGAGTAILKLVAEGSFVKKGDFLAKLDSSALETDLTTQQINVNNAEAVMIESKNAYETAVIAKREYDEGTFVQERQAIESEVFVAEENLSRAEETLQYSERLAIKGYVTEQQLQADRFAVEKYKKELDAAKTKLDVLVNFTREKMLKQLDSDIITAKAKWDSMLNSFELEQKTLAEIEDQIEKCTLTSPIDGVVRYAHERESRRDDGLVIEEGVVVRERQAIIRLPKRDSMLVKIKVNEAWITRVKAGMPAQITPRGLDRVLEGEVIEVAQYAEPESWRKPDVREYETTLSINNPPLNLRSGMSATVKIMCMTETDVIAIPAQAIYTIGRESFCLIPNGDEWDARSIKLGPKNDANVIINSGLKVGESVALAAHSLVEMGKCEDLEKLAKEHEQKEKDKEAGAQPEQPAAKPKPKAASRMPSVGDMMKGLDKDKNGKVEVSELSGRAAGLSKFDADSNGELSATELKTAMQSFAKQAQGASPQGSSRP